MAKRVLCIGGAGYIGSVVSKFFERKGCEVAILDNFTTSKKREPRHYHRLYEFDLKSTDRVREALLDFEPNLIIHLAAYAYVGESVVDPLKYYSNNVGGLCSLLHAIDQLDFKTKMIFSSSCAIYGNANSELISEDCPKNPINPYGRTKLICEQILKDWIHANASKDAAVILRYFNAAGADISNNLGEMHDPETHLIPLAIASGFTSEQLQIFGTDWDTKDGTPVRDYIHVLDIAEAHWLVAEALFNGSLSGLNEYNLGSGVGFSVHDILAELTKQGVSVRTKVCDRRLGDPSVLTASNKKIQTDLDWKPKLSLERIISDAIKFYLWTRKNSE